MASLHLRPVGKRAVLSESPNIPDTVEMTDLEKRLARRLHNQRRRLRQLEEFKGWGKWHHAMRRMYIALLRKRETELRELRAARPPRPFWHRVLDHFNIKN